jgi:hypothetical protein
LKIFPCGPPGIGAEKSGTSLRTDLELRSTYKVASSVALEGAVMDLYIGSKSINSSALEVACPPPGIGAKFELVLLMENALLVLKSNANES